MRLAVFDLDGTLADTAPDLVGALNDLLAAEGLPSVDPTATRIVAGRGGKALIRHGWAAAGRPLTEDAVTARFAAYLAAYAARIDRETRLYPEAEATLDRLAADGWGLAVCTNKPHGLALDLLDRLGLGARFAAVVGADVLPVRKPDPRHLTETIARAGGALGRSVLIGDTVTDRDAARAAGVPVALCRFGYAPEPVETLAPDAVIGHYREAAAALERLLPR